MGFYGLAASLVLVWTIAVGAVAYSKGSASRNPEISELRAAIKSSEVLAAEVADRAAKPSARVVTVYKDRIKTIREVTPGEIQVVERVIREADPSCVLPPSFNQLWDGKPASGDSAGQDPQEPDGTPIPLADIAEPTRLARKAYNEAVAKLIGLGNFKDERALPVLTRALSEGDDAVRGYAAWAIGTIGGSRAAGYLSAARERETNAEVLKDIELAREAARR